MNIGFTEATLRKLWPHGDSKVPGLIAGLVAAQDAVYAKWNIKNDNVVAQMMAQFSHECGAGLEMVENINYTAQRAAEVWPLHANDKYAYRHFSSANDCYTKCKSYPGDPLFHVKLINLVYGDRNGNRAGTNDGYDFIGRGLPQLTGRANYEQSFRDTGVDVVSHPEWASSPEHALEVGVADFIACGCLPYAERGDIDGVTLKLNGGHIGLAERKEWLSRWRAALAAQGPRPTPVAPPVAPVRPEDIPQTAVGEGAQNLKTAPWASRNPIPKPHHAAAAATIVATGAAAKGALDAGTSPNTVLALVIGGIALAVVLFVLLRQKG